MTDEPLYSESAGSAHNGTVLSSPTLHRIKVTNRFQHQQVWVGRLELRPAIPYLCLVNL